MSEILPYSLPPDMNLLTKAEQRTQLEKTTAQLERFSEEAEKATLNFMQVANFTVALADTMKPGTHGRRQEFRNAIELLDAAGRTAQLIMKACAMRRGGIPFVPEVINATQNNYYSAPVVKEASQFTDIDVKVN